MGNRQWFDSGKSALMECMTSVQSVYPKYLNEVAVLSQCITVSALVHALYGLAMQW